VCVFLYILFGTISTAVMQKCVRHLCTERLLAYLLT